MERQEMSFMQQHLEIQPPGAATHAGKIPLSEEVQVVGNTFFPLSLIELNRQVPLGSQVMNHIADPLPAGENTHRFKVDATLLAQAHDLSNPLELPEPAVLRASVVQTGF